MEDGGRALPSGLAAGLVFLASGAVLVLEVVALRLVGPYVGVTLQTSSAVIGMALGAIAYGAWLGGRLADMRDPRRVLAPLLVLAAVATALTLPVVRYAGEVLRGSAAGGTLLLTGLAVFVPAALLSAVTPLVVKLQLADLRRTGQVVGKLSSIGTLGAITATLATGFVLVAALPTSAILLSLAVLLGLAGLALWFYLGGWRRGGGRGGRATAAGAAVGLAAATLTVLAPSPCDVETAYHCAAVRVDPKRPTGRVLLLNSARHSYVDTADPRHLEFAYVQWIGALADVQRPAGEPLDVLHLGGGGFTLPTYLNATRPGSRNLVIEIDGGLVALDRARLGVRAGPGLDIEIRDARVGVAAQPPASRSLVIGDAFGHLVVPWHLATREFVAEVRRVLRPDGIYAQNVIDYAERRFIRAELATVAAEFPYVAVAGPPEALTGPEPRGDDGFQGANFVIAASPQPLPLAAWRERLAAAAPEPVTVLDGADLIGFIGSARILTDNYAPVDQLLTRA